MGDGRVGLGAGGGRKAPSLLLAAAAIAMSACTPRVALEAPQEPITINLNIKIEQEVRIRVERDLEQVFEENSDIF